MSEFTSNFYAKFQHYHAYNNMKLSSVLHHIKELTSKAILSQIIGTLIIPE